MLDLPTTGPSNWVARKTSVKPHPALNAAAVARRMTRSSTAVGRVCGVGGTVWMGGTVCMVRSGNGVCECECATDRMLYRTSAFSFTYSGNWLGGSYFFFHVWEGQGVPARAIREGRLPYLAVTGQTWLGCCQDGRGGRHAAMGA
jgi:hypothetical protein